jgi:uncharacterized protein (TIGR02646 family)
MRSINKGLEPNSLTQHRCSCSQHSNFENYSEKKELRKALISEQQGLCCYCMGRISASSNSMKIEHWHCQANHPDEQLDYRNLLGACRGGEGQPMNKQHCDTKKGNLELKWNPADPQHTIEAHIAYGMDGTISSGDSDFNRQIDEVLNLNLDIFKNRRKGVLDGVLKWWKLKKQKLHAPVPKKQIQNQIDKYNSNSGELSPYCQVAVWWLSRKI